MSHEARISATRDSRRTLWTQSRAAEQRARENAAMFAAQGRDAFARSWADCVNAELEFQVRVTASIVESHQRDRQLEALLAA